MGPSCSLNYKAKTNPSAAKRSRKWSKPRSPEFTSGLWHKKCDHEVWQKQIIHAPEASLFSSVNFKLSSLVYVLGILELAMYVRMARNLQQILLSLKC